LVPYAQPVPGLDIAVHVRNLVDSGLRIVIVSNAGPRRAALAAAKLGLPYIAKAGKPGRKAFDRALDELACGPHETAVVGDQVFRDILGARRMGCLALLVIPMSQRDFPGTKLLRGPEALLMRYLRARDLWPGSNSP